jgi:hypothetical protein
MMRAVEHALAVLVETLVGQVAVGVDHGKRSRRAVGRARNQPLRPRTAAPGIIESRPATPSGSMASPRRPRP